MDKSKWGVHETHCCLKHGCKYGDGDCPVVLGQIKQMYRCEDCPPIIPDTITIERMGRLMYTGFENWVNTNDEDKVTITHNGNNIPELTALQNELVDIIKRKYEIERELDKAVTNPDLYVRKLKINHLKASKNLKDISGFPTKEGDK